jgi:hypothetical protein
MNRVLIFRKLRKIADVKKHNANMAHLADNLVLLREQFIHNDRRHMLAEHPHNFVQFLEDFYGPDKPSSIYTATNPARTPETTIIRLFAK